MATTAYPIEHSSHSPSKLTRLIPVPESVEPLSLLVVDDSRSVREFLCGYLGMLGGFVVEQAATMAEAGQLLARDPGRFFCAALDLTLPDAPSGEVVDMVRAHDIPVIVLTGSTDPAQRARIMEKDVVDYVIKGNPHEIEHVAYLIGRLRENRRTKILVVDDSASFRLYLTSLLSRYFFQTLEATNGREALAVLAEHPDTTLVITDVNMPEMDGFQLIRALRQQHRREDLAIIGVSDASQHDISAQLLKLGANDFLGKPFVVEEFYCRVTQNTNMVAYVRQVRDSAIRDFLTGVYNRRHLYEVATTLYGNARRGRIVLMTMLVDADRFKSLNDNYGHAAGDLVLRKVARCIQGEIRSCDVVARYGGEEFVVLAVLREPADAGVVCERVRAAVENCRIEFEGQSIPVTVSIGATTEPGANFEAMLKSADSAMYYSKENGRNRWTLASPGLPA